MNIAESMRQDWDDRARKDAFHYIASWRDDWDEGSFLRSGEDDYVRLVEPVLDRSGFSLAGKSVLEIGCGAGRMTQSFAQRFAKVLAVDISGEMLSSARAIHRSLSNIEWRQTNGVDLAGTPSDSVDMVFSYIVLQHLPNETMVLSYIREIVRVLRGGGVALFQFNGSASTNMNWKGRASWSVIDRLWSLGFVRASKSAAKLCGFDPQMAGKTWHGAGIDSERVVQSVEQAGGSVLEVTGENTPMTWCCATKDPRES